MTKRLLLFVCLIAVYLNLNAQQHLDPPPKKLEYQIGYFGEFIANPGFKIGVAYPFAQTVKLIEKQKRKNSFLITKVHRWKVGTNLAFYHQVNNHNGYLWNVELTYQKVKNKSKRASKFKYFDVSAGLGYFHYELQGTTFKPTENDFEKINGNGNALMPTLAVAWGRNIGFVKRMDMRYYIKPTVLFEIPAGVNFHTRFAMEIGLTSSF